MILETIHEQLTETLKSRVLALFGHSIERVVLQAPPKLSMGDLATPVALELAKVLKRKPREIAEQLSNGLALPIFVESVSVEGAGFLNFVFDRGAFTAQHFRTVMMPAKPSGERGIVEHTNINPNKAAHIGHLRNAVLGDTYVRCSKWLGDRVETQNYIDDTGVQVADVVVAFELLEKKSVAEVQQLIDTHPRFDYLCWDSYSRMAQYYADRPEAQEWRKDTLHRIEKQEGDTAVLAKTLARAIVRRHLATMLRLGIEYDLLPKESDIIHAHFWDRAFELLKQSGALVFEEEGKHKGCWVMKLDESETFAGMEEPDKILVRSNGTVTYTGKDIAYQLWKLGLLDRTFQYQKFSTYPDGHIVWETTHGEDGDPAAPNFGGATDAVKANATDIENAGEIGNQVAVAALRYFMLRFGRNKVIAFDFDEALRFEGDSGPYLQYSTVRVQNIFRKMQERGVEARLEERIVDDLTLNQGLTDDMWELIRSSAELPAAIRRAVDSLELSVITQYLLDLAQRFNSFYHKYPIMNEKDDAERQRRAVTAEIFRRTMVGAMELLGIPVPERM